MNTREGEKIEILAESLIDEHPRQALRILGYCSKLGRILGWHYLLDIIWILENLDCPAGGTVLDAGAGNGILQFILASLGYRVISVDVKERKFPQFARNLFHIDFWGGEDDLEHPYLEWHRMSGSKSTVPREVVPDGSLPRMVYYHSKLDDMRHLEDGGIDAVVSLSALEHNPPRELAGILAELQRVLKKGENMLITVSAAAKSFFHQPSYSWVMDEEDLLKYYRLGKHTASNFDRIDELFLQLRNSVYLKEWLAGLYYGGDKNGMPLGKWDPQYLPVAIKKVNR